MVALLTERNAGRALLGSNASCSFQFVGARNLVELVSTSPSSSLNVTVEETITTKNVGFICLVAIPEYI
jgi:hypothetical protein